MLFRFKYFLKLKRDGKGGRLKSLCMSNFQYKSTFRNDHSIKKNTTGPWDWETLQNVTLKASLNKKARLKLPFKAYCCSNKTMIGLAKSWCMYKFSCMMHRHRYIQPEPRDRCVIMKTHSEDVCGTAAPLVHSSLTLAVVSRQEHGSERVRAGILH